MSCSPESFQPCNKQTRFRFGSEPVNVVLKSSSTAENWSVSLRELVESKCKSLFSDYRPTWWLPNGHLQTVYPIVGGLTQVDKLWYQRRLIRLVDGGTLGLDFTPLDASAVPEDAPIIVVQHGLTGGSHEPYVRAILVPACTPVEHGGLGYRGVVINFRGCSGVPITSPKFYTAAQTDDLRQGLLYVSALFPNAPLLGLGFSIGGNVLAKYLAEEGVHSRLSAACILGCPWNLKASNDCLLRGTLGKRVYLRGMGENILVLMRQHQHAFLKDPTHPTATAIQRVFRLNKPTLTEIDHIFTCFVGDKPPFPFSSVHDYYTWASSHECVDRIRVPCLTINALDDPIVQRVQMPPTNNDYIVAVLTASGGHLGWFTGCAGRKRWTTKPVLEWMEVMGREVIASTMASVPFTDEAGYLRDARWPNLGCKEVSGGGLIDGNRPESKLFQGL